MSDVMLIGVLRMPLELAMSDELSRMQFHGRAQQAADRIVADAEAIERKDETIARLHGLLRECLELEDNWPGIAYTADLKARIDAQSGIKSTA